MCMQYISYGSDDTLNCNIVLGSIDTGGRGGVLVL